MSEVKRTILVVAEAVGVESQRRLAAALIDTGKGARKAASGFRAMDKAQARQAATSATQANALQHLISINAQLTRQTLENAAAMREQAAASRKAAAEAVKARSKMGAPLTPKTAPTSKSPAGGKGKERLNYMERQRKAARALVSDVGDATTMFRDMDGAGLRLGDTLDQMAVIMSGPLGIGIASVVLGLGGAIATAKFLTAGLQKTIQKSEELTERSEQLSDSYDNLQVAAFGYVAAGIDLDAVMTGMSRTVDDAARSIDVATAAHESASEGARAEGGAVKETSSFWATYRDVLTTTTPIVGDVVSVLRTLEHVGNSSAGSLGGNVIQARSLVSELGLLNVEIVSGVDKTWIFTQRIDGLGSAFGSLASKASNAGAAVASSLSNMLANAGIIEQRKSPLASFVERKLDQAGKALGFDKKNKRGGGGGPKTIQDRIEITPKMQANRERLEAELRETERLTAARFELEEAMRQINIEAAEADRRNEVQMQNLQATKLQTEALLEQAMALGEVNDANREALKNDIARDQILNQLSDGLGSSLIPNLQDTGIAVAQTLGAFAVDEGTVSAFKDSMLDMAADIAEQYGQLFIAQGTAMMFVNPGIGLGLLAGGAALMGVAGASRAKGSANAGRSASSGARRQVERSIDRTFGQAGRAAERQARAQVLLIGDREFTGYLHDSVADARRRGVRGFA